MMVMGAAVVRMMMPLQGSPLARSAVEGKRLKVVDYVGMSGAVNCLWWF